MLTKTRQIVNHEDDLKNLINHAKTFCESGIKFLISGNLTESFKYFTEAHKTVLEIYKDEDSIDVANSFFNLGVQYYLQGNHVESLSLHRKAYEIYIKKFGEEGVHHNLCSSLFNLGLVSYTNNNFEDSLLYHFKCYNMKVKLYNDTDHFDTARSLYRIATAYMKLKDFSSCLKYHMLAYEMLSRLCTGPNEELAESMYQLGLIYNCLQQYDNSLKYHKLAFDMRLVMYRIVTARNNSILNSINIHIGNSLYALGIVFLNIRQFKNSIEHLDMSITYYSIAFPNQYICLPNHRSLFAKSLAYLALCSDPTYIGEFEENLEKARMYHDQSFEMGFSLGLPFEELLQIYREFFCYGQSPLSIDVLEVVISKCKNYGQSMLGEKLSEELDSNNRPQE